MFIKFKLNEYYITKGQARQTRIMLQKFVIILIKYILI